MIDSGSCTLLNSADNRMREIQDEKPVLGHFADVLIREAIAMNANINEQSARNVIESSALSWAVMENQRKEVIVERLRAIEHLDESQCNELFDKMDKWILQQPNKRQDCIVALNRIMKCMCSVSVCFQC